MPNIELKAYQATEITFVNKLESGTRVELANKYSYNVGYSNNNTCKGEFSIEVADKTNEEKFNVKVVIAGIFTFSPDMQKERIHVESFKMLFPYARALITTITANAGIPPIIIPTIDIESQSIYKFEKPQG
jgi:preprotein translocase subunit SecB